MRLRFLLLAFAVCALGVVIDRILAIVNESVITQSEVYAIEKLDLRVSGLPQQSSTLQNRIDHHLVLQEFSRQPPLPIDEDELNEVINSYKERFASEDAFAEFLSSIGMNYQDFLNEVRQQIMINHLITERFRPFITISVEQAERYYKEQYVPRLKSEGKEVPSFPASFEEIQALLLEQEVVERVRTWLQELRAEAQIAIKQ